MVSRDLVARGGALGRVPDARSLPLASPFRRRRVSKLRVTADGLSVPSRNGWIDFAPTDHLHVRSNTAPAEWTALLREASPYSTEHGWLELVWEAGDPWNPGHRWTLYEMEHPRFVEGTILDELEGPHPRTEGHMCSTKVPKQFQCLCKRKLETWRGGPCALITVTQWGLFRRTGCYGNPFWIIQGERGGHKFRFTEKEQEMLRLLDQPGEPPSLGDLSYAPFDARVLRHIHRLNRLRMFGVTLGQFKRQMGPEFEQHQARLATELRAEYVKWFEEQLLDVNDLFITAQRNGGMEKERRTSVDYERVEDIATGQYIETGILPSAMEIQRTHRTLF